MFYWAFCILCIEFDLYVMRKISAQCANVEQIEPWRIRVLGLNVLGMHEKFVFCIVRRFAMVVRVRSFRVVGLKPKFDGVDHFPLRTILARIDDFCFQVTEERLDHGIVLRCMGTRGGLDDIVRPEAVHETPRQVGGTPI